MFEFRLKFHWSLFLRFQLTIFQHWFRYWLGAVQATSHYVNQWWLVYWCIYASLGLNEIDLEHTRATMVLWFQFDEIKKWHHQMETFSAVLALCEGNPPVTGGFHSQRPLTWSFDVFFDLFLNKRLSKQSRCWWFETSSRSFWRRCNAPYPYIRVSNNVCCWKCLTWERILHPFLYVKLYWFVLLFNPFNIESNIIQTNCKA